MWEQIGNGSTPMVQVEAVLLVFLATARPALKAARDLKERLQFAPVNKWLQPTGAGWHSARALTALA